MRPKILFLPSWYPDEEDFVRGIFFQDQARLLAEECDVGVLVCHVVWWRHILERKLGPHPGGGERDGLIVYRERGFMPLPRIPRLFFRAYAAAAERGFRRMRADWGEPDLIHAQGVLPAGYAAVKLGKKHRKPVVLTEHSGPFVSYLGTEYRRRLVSETLASVSHLVAVSPSALQEIRAFQRVSESSVIGNLVNTRFFVPSGNAGRGQREEKTHFVCVALLTEGKGVEHLLAAAKLLIEQGMSSFELVIGGDGPDRERLEGLVRSTGLAEHCRFLGLLTSHEVRHWLQWCDVFVLPSLHETFGIVLGEAMACGKPIISTLSGGPEFIVTPETGWLVDTANPAQLAEVMKQFMQGSRTFDANRIRQSVVDRFGERAFLENVLQVYTEVLERS